MSRACDLIVSGGLLVLLLFTPFAFGSVHPWAYMALESAIYFLVAVALAKIICQRRWPVSATNLVRSLAVPLGLFLGVVTIQLLPLPPTLLNFLSPATYQLYQTSLPGWPDKPAYAELLKLAPAQAAPTGLLATVEELRQTDNRQSNQTRQTAAQPASALVATWKSVNFFPWSWRPLSIAPSLTATDLNKFLAYGGLFFLILLYPLSTASPDAKAARENSVRRALVLTLLGCATLVALVGIVQRFAGNGKILWHFVPYDWDSAASGVIARASGPFVNPDHFANYLALSFPFAIALALKPRAWFAPGQVNAARLYCMTSAAIIFMAILLSLSRQGWLCALLAIVLVALMTRPANPAPRLIWFRWRTLVTASYGAAAVIGLLTLTVWLAGPQARQALDQRVSETIAGDRTLTTRISIWRDSLPLIGDFPLLGTGLGTWSELFPRYQSAAAVEVYFREAHNDFLELLAETGAIGFILLGIFFYRGGRLIIAALRAAPEYLRVFLAPALAALALMLVHEFFDFSLQIPANAMLFTLVLAMALRLALNILAPRPRPAAEIKTWLPAGAIAVAALLSALTFTQDWLPYPYNLGVPANLAEAAERIERYPAQAAGHALIGQLLAERAPVQRQLDEYRIATRLQPNDPRLRDLYAGALMRAGQREQSLHEIRQSLALAPLLERHFYLNEKLLPFLADDERRAIEAGFEQAIANGNLLAMENLSRFYHHTGQPLAQAKLFQTRAASTSDSAAKCDLAVKAGQSYVAAGQLTEAEKMFKAAIAASPQDPRSYQALSLSVYARQGNAEAVSAIIGQGVAAKADEVTLDLSLAEAMKALGNAGDAATALDRAEKKIRQLARLGDDALPRYLALADAAQRMSLPEREQNALEQALELRPSQRDLLIRLGGIYLNLQRNDRAALVFSRLTKLAPDSATAFHLLGRAEEARYGYTAADLAYARAAQLAPANQEFADQRERFKQKLAANLNSPGK